MCMYVYVGRYSGSIKKGSRGYEDFFFMRGSFSFCQTLFLLLGGKEYVKVKYFSRIKRLIYVLGHLVLNFIST